MGSCFSKVALGLATGVLLVVIGSSTPRVVGQVPPDHSATVDAVVTVPPAASHRAAARLHVGDTLDLKVFGVPEMNQEVSVNDNGVLDMPWIGAVHAAGETIEEVRSAIEQKLRDKGFINEPHVALTPKEVAGQTVSVVGEVTKPGTYPPVNSRLLIDQISAAGGMTPRAGKSALIAHRDDPGPPARVQLDIGSATRASNLTIEPGDTVVVPRAGMVYVVGDVNRPASIIMDNDRMTVLEAIAIAGGVSSTAALNGARILRRTPQTIEEIHVPLKPILSAKVKDTELQPNDILFVPGSKSKAFAKRGSEVIVGVAVSAAVVWR
jgi:polysaccharide export outer membrane protein